MVDNGNDEVDNTTTTTTNTQVAILKRLEQVGMHEKESRIEHRSMPRASVLVPLFWKRKNNDNDDSSELHMILTLRPQTLRNHPGEVCFPGGKQDCDLDGTDDVATAMRETHEEIGLEYSSIQPICRLSSLESYTGLCVTPIVAIIHMEHPQLVSSLSIQPEEVEVAFTVPVSYFHDDNKHWTSKEMIEWRGDTFEMRTYHYHCMETGRTFKIWGLTAHIAHQVAQLVCPPIVPHPEKKNASCTTTASSMPTITMISTHPQPSISSLWSAYLYRRVPVLLSSSSSSSSSLEHIPWSRKYFVCTSQMLHQYDNDAQALKKSHAANKKNRLPLIDVQIVRIPEMAGPADQQSSLILYGFMVRVLQGRIEWHLATENETERQRWIELLSSSSSSESGT
jgi:8-oxo-dGTP pyrophosphatase MutT (NUDIX family)